MKCPWWCLLTGDSSPGGFFMTTAAFSFSVFFPIWRRLKFAGFKNHRPRTIMECSLSNLILRSVLTNEIYQLKITCRSIEIYENNLYISMVRRCPLMRQSGCSFSFSVPCVREIEKVELKIVKTKPKYRNVTRFSKLLRSALQSSLKLVCEASLRKN